MAKLSPMMQQYMETKAQYKDCILFYRLGDFYEMFFEDALLASRELEITLTGRDCGLEERAPMCGVPFHAAEVYLDKLVKKGYKVAIVEQVEDPRLAKGLVKREVIRVVTPGTNILPNALEEGRNNYILCITYLDGVFGLAACDISTGEFFVTQVSRMENLYDEIYRFSPAEILSNQALGISGLDFEILHQRLSFSETVLEDRYFSDDACEKVLETHFHAASIQGLGLESFEGGTLSAGALLQYLFETQKNDLAHISHLQVYTTGRYMLLDTATRRNLELTETLREKQKKGSLLWVLDKTGTAMGSRLLRKYVEQPLVSKNAILARQDGIAELMERYVDREEIREYLRAIYDLERLIGRISYKSANPRDLIAFLRSLEMLPPIHQILSGFNSTLLQQLEKELDPLTDLSDLLGASIVEDPPISVREGGIIKDGFHPDIDYIRKAKAEGKTWLAELEVRERESSGIKSLKLKYNKVFGYYLEVPNSNKMDIPAHYTRKQTLSNAERYSTEELKRLEDIILGAEDKLYNLEYQVFCDIRDQIGAQVERIQATAQAIAALDVLVSLALTAERHRYCRPEINEKGILEVRGGRHPVVEQMISEDRFVPNDVYLDDQENRVAVITGPNMAGKSTYMRQVALIALMAQMGAYVPADSANICISDRIFTRVGASDDLASGQSTFMVEMTEVSHILRNATSKSLLILDEIGRGTSTFDGLSIAWAVVEYISDTRILGAKTLFATHYHELTELEGTLSGVHNYCIAVKEQGEDIVFLRKIIQGGADKSYGIQVAKLAGVPDRVIDRAKELLEELTDADIAQQAREIAKLGQSGKKEGKKHHIARPDEVDVNQLTLFDTVSADGIVQEISDLEISQMTPLDALNFLFQIQAKLKNRFKG